MNPPSNQSSPTTSSRPEWANPEWSQRVPSIILRGESDKLEFKASFPDPARELAKEIAAFATSGGGTILIGITDEREVVGVPGGDTSEGRKNVISKLEGICRDVIAPAVAVTPMFAQVEGKPVLVIEVCKGTASVYYFNNVPYLRQLTSSRPALPHEVDDLVIGWNERRKPNQPNGLEVFEQLAGSAVSFDSSDLKPGFKVITFDEKAGRDRSVIVADGPWVSIKVTPDPPGGWRSETALWTIAESAIEMLAPPNSNDRSLECQRNGHGAAVWVPSDHDPNIAVGATQIYRHGEIRSVDTTLLRSCQIASADGTSVLPCIPLEILEETLTDATRRLAGFALTVLNLAPTVEVILGIENVERYRLSYSSRQEGWMSRRGAWGRPLRLNDPWAITRETVAPLLAEIWDLCGLPAARFPRK